MNNTGTLYDLQSFALFRRSVTTCFRRKHDAQNRGSVTGFSERSGSRMRRYLRSCVAEYRVFITLTYPEKAPKSGREVKEHLRCFLQRLKRWSERRSGPGADFHSYAAERFSAFWFLEFQERGAPHLHIFFTQYVPKDWIAQSWYDVVDSGDERHLHAGTRIEEIRSGRRGVCSYASKYAAKHEQKIVPEDFSDVGRFWGVAGNRRTKAASIFIPTDVILQHMESVPGTIVDAFKNDLYGTVRRYKGQMRKMNLKGWSSGIYIRTEEAQAAINDVFRMYGPLLEQVGCAFTYPEREMLIEDLRAVPPA